ncbi:HNH endonuclease [Acinetobacter seifertii]|uniref:HNH endonuclease n=1 Tax=Acinetobacter seifertii TaxID=1530123 RepID=UPI00148E7323|nr:HNH endonuclease [Acinetobacter seifertii]
MIKVEKDLNNIPPSLSSKPEDLTGHSRRKARTTYKRRLEHIRAKKYINDDNHNDRYKTNDIRDRLKSIYNDKCAYCETKVEQYHVDHYRPKAIYYWLAYSWDNLIISCPICNEHKNDFFDIHGEQRARFRTRYRKINDINSISARYDAYEKPKLINVENFDPYPHLIFDRYGMISSGDPNVSYTINQCKIDRKWLNDERKKILDDIEAEFKLALSINQSIDEQKVAYKTILNNFFRKASDDKEEYLAYRKFALKEGLISSILKSI